MSSEHGSNILLRLRKGGPVRSGARREMPRSHHNQYNANAITDNIITSMVGIYIYIIIYTYICWVWAMLVDFVLPDKKKSDFHWLWAAFGGWLPWNLSAIHFRLSNQSWANRPCSRELAFFSMETRYVRCIEYLKHTMYTTNYHNIHDIFAFYSRRL